MFIFSLRVHPVVKTYYQCMRTEESLGHPQVQLPLPRSTMSHIYCQIRSYKS